MPTTTALTPATALQHGTRMAPASKRPAAPAMAKAKPKASRSALNAGVLWIVWFGAVALMLTLALSR